MQSGGLCLLRGHLQKDWKDLPRRSLVWWAPPAPPFPVVPPRSQGWPGPAHVHVPPGRAQRRSLQGAGVVGHVSLPEAGAWDHLRGTRCNPSFSLLQSVPRRNPESPPPQALGDGDYPSLGGQGPGREVLSHSRYVPRMSWSWILCAWAVQEKNIVRLK